MKLLAAVLTATVLGLLGLPIVLTGGDTPPPTSCATAGDIGPILATIRTIESGGDYNARSRGSTASGAYQFLDTTWNNYDGYRSAWLAPPAVQDAKATVHVNGILTGNGGRLDAVPVVWYIGHVPADGLAEWDAVPYPDAGNTITPRQYQHRWLTTHQRITGNDDTGGAVSCAATSTGESVSDGWALPGPRQLLEATAVQLDNPHAADPAWDWIIPTGTPIYAIRAGAVARVTRWNHNWWDTGCGTQGGGDCTTCGIGVTIVDNDSVRWTYCHGSNVHVAEGQTIQAGQQILTSGNTGRSGTPHVHLEIRINDVQHCPQPLMHALVAHADLPAPSTLPTTGCTD